jgi:hypothetical protein
MRHLLMAQNAARPVRQMFENDSEIFVKIYAQNSTIAYFITVSRFR